MSVLFGGRFPERYFNVGIAEQNMLSVAAGLAAAGKTAFCGSFSVFASGRAYDQIRQTIAIGRLNVKICGSSAGLSDFGDGGTHQSVEDIALMSAIPSMTVLTPWDAPGARMAVRVAAEREGPVFIRLSRHDLPELIPEGDGDIDKNIKSFEPVLLKKGGDIFILAHGCMVSAAMEAAEMLEKEGVSAGVAGIGAMKPFPYDCVRELAENVKGIITAEDHNYIGGLASAAAFALRQSKTPMDYVAVEDVFGQSARSLEPLMAHYGLTAENIAVKALELLNKR